MWLPGRETRRNQLTERIMVVVVMVAVSSNGRGHSNRGSILVKRRENHMKFSCTLAFTEIGKILAASLSAFPSLGLNSLLFLHAAFYVSIPLSFEKTTIFSKTLEFLPLGTMTWSHSLSAQCNMIQILCLKP